MESSSTPDMSDYSPSTTTIRFDAPLPLLRGPVLSGRSDCPESGPYVLAFRSIESWTAAFKSSVTLIVEQCEEGARVGCALVASNKCKPPWWQGMMGQTSKSSLKEREKCEEREMEGCFAEARQKCVALAKEKCSRSFLDARIAACGVPICPKRAERLTWVASAPERNAPRGCICEGRLDLAFMEWYDIGVTNYIAKALLSSESESDLLFE